MEKKVLFFFIFLITKGIGFFLVFVYFLRVGRGKDTTHNVLYEMGRD